MQWGTPATGHTAVGPSRGELATIWVGFPLLGAGAGWLVKAVLGWLAALPWLPLPGPLRLLASMPEPQATIGGLAVGFAGGTVIAFLAAADYLHVTVSDHQLTIAHGKRAQTVPRSAIGAVFRDGKRLVVLGHDTELLAAMTGELDAQRLGTALHARGYPWRPDGDPHQDAYHRWVEDTPDLPPGANAILKAQARALEKGDQEDVAELRQELAKLGIVVREEKKRQYWRRDRRQLTGPDGSTDEPTHG